MAIVKEQTAEDVCLQEQFEERLRSNPHYFYLYTWFGDKLERMGKEEMLQFVKTLFCVTKRPRTESQMEKMEFDVSKSYEVLLGFFVEAFAIAGVKRRYIPKAYRLNDQGKSYAIALVSQGMDPEYLPGVRYLHRWGQLYVSTLKGKLPTCDPVTYDGVKEFQRLSKKAKGFVLGAKFSVLSTHKSVGSTYFAEEALAVLREIVALDPLCYEWHYLLGNLLRCQVRRRPGLPWSRVSEDEEKVLWETYEHCDYVKTEGGRNSRLRNRALAGVLQAIAEIIKFRSRNVSSAPLSFGDWKFATDNDAAAFIVKEIERMMQEAREDNRRPNFAELIRAGEMLSVLLPDGFRDVKTAEKYYLEAMGLDPKNSKVHHKLGILYLTSEELRDIPKSLKHFRIAWKNEASNFPSAIDLIGTLMSDWKHNRKEIEDETASLLNNNKINAKDRSQTLFVHGSLKFVLGDKMNAVQLWMESDKAISNSTFRFNTLGHNVKRYQWNTKDFPDHEIQDAIKGYREVHAKSLSPDDLQALLKMSESPMLRVFRSAQSKGQHDDVVERSRGQRRNQGRDTHGGQNNWRISHGNLSDGQDRWTFHGRSAQAWGNNYHGRQSSSNLGGAGYHDRIGEEGTRNWRSRDGQM